MRPGVEVRQRHPGRDTPEIVLIVGVVTEVRPVIIAALATLIVTITILITTTTLALALSIVTRVPPDVATLLSVSIHSIPRPLFQYIIL